MSAIPVSHEVEVRSLDPEARGSEALQVAPGDPTVVEITAVGSSLSGDVELREKDGFDLTGRVFEVGLVNLTPGDTARLQFTMPDWPGSRYAVYIGGKRARYSSGITSDPKRTHNPDRGISMSEYRSGVRLRAPEEKNAENVETEDLIEIQTDQTMEPPMNYNEGIDLATLPGVVPADNEYGAALGPARRRKRSEPVEPGTVVKTGREEVVVGPIEEADEVARHATGPKAGDVVESDAESVMSSTSNDGDGGVLDGVEPTEAAVAIGALAALGLAYRRS
jgi:hypothetical protein